MGSEGVRTAGLRLLARRLAPLLVGVVLIITYGIVGYMFFGFGLLDAAYMTTLALTTVGFTSDVQLTSGARLFTMSIAVLGVVMTLALVAVVTSTITEGRIGLTARRRRMDNKIAELRDHFIIAAYGRVGRTVTREFEAEGVPFVVLDKNDELEELMVSDGVLPDRRPYF